MQFFTQTASTPLARTAGRTKVCHRPSFRSFCSIMQRGSPPQVFIKDSLVHNWRRRSPTHSALWHRGSVLERPATPHWIAKIKTTALHLPDSTFLPLGLQEHCFWFLFFWGGGCFYGVFFFSVHISIDPRSTVSATGFNKRGNSKGFNVVCNERPAKGWEAFC